MRHSGNWGLQRLSARAALIVGFVSALSGVAQAGPQQPQPPMGSWVKDNNNGAVTCEAFCGNKGGGGGRLGVCVSGWGARTGRTLQCQEPAEGPRTVCFCKDPPQQPSTPAGAWIKDNASGNVSCDNYCGNKGGDWGKRGACVSGWGAVSGKTLACAQQEQSKTICFCKDVKELVQPQPPPGAWVKEGNNGTINCETFCGNKGGNWGKPGACVGGWGATSGSTLSCTGQGESPRTVCFCKDVVQPQPPAGAWVKDGNNGTVTCDQFCGNALANWGKLGTCVAGWGASSGSNLPCDRGETPHTVCFCKDKSAAVATSGPPPTHAALDKVHIQTASSITESRGRLTALNTPPQHQKAQTSLNAVWAALDERLAQCKVMTDTAERSTCYSQVAKGVEHIKQLQAFHTDRVKATLAAKGK